MGAIVMLGTRVCTNCNETKKRLLEAFGITVEKIVIDHENEQHLRLVEESKAAGYIESPIIAHQHEDGTLEWIASGMAKFAQMKTDRFIKANLSLADA